MLYVETRHKKSKERKEKSKGGPPTELQGLE